VHFALESEGGLSHGFYGALARGASYETEAAMEVEYVVGIAERRVRSGGIR